MKATHRKKTLLHQDLNKVDTERTGEMVIYLFISDVLDNEMVGSLFISEDTTTQLRSRKRMARPKY